MGPKMVAGHVERNKKTDKNSANKIAAIPYSAYF